MSARGVRSRRLRQALAALAGTLALFTGSLALAADPPPAGTLLLQPQAASENCSAAQDALETLIGTLESEIPPALLAEARQHLAADAAVAEAWSDFAAAVLLMGDLQLAAWAGLQATTLDWDAELVGNAGTYLLHAGRDAALTWLLCARDIGFGGHDMEYSGQSLPPYKAGESHVAMSKLLLGLKKWILKVSPGLGGGTDKGVYSVDQP